MDRWEIQMHVTFNNSAHFIYNIQKNNRIKKEESIKKLSSGLRIVNSSDDVAGLAISEKMRAQIRGLYQAERNVQDFISLTQIIDSGLNEITESIQRMRELAISALNDTYTDRDRKMIQEEFRNLKKHISDISNYTEFNTMNVYQQHMSTYEQFKGNKVLEDQLTVIKGVNDYLGISVDGEFKEVYLDAGTYSREAFLDMLDDKLWEVDRNLIPSIDKNNILSLSAENYKKIDALIGGALGFFYEYHIGMGAGVVIGSSDLSGKLDIIKGSNNQFTFNIGDKKYTIDFPPTPEPSYMGNGYTAEEIVEIMQNQLDAQGANVKVYMNGNQIALDAGYHIIDGFAGNMIKIDGITSILYDNAKHGHVYRTSGYVQSRVPYNTSIEIIEDINDTIGFYLDGDDQKYEIKLTAKVYNNLSEIADEINKQFEENNIGARAEIAYSDYHDIYKRLAIYSNTAGARSKVELDTESSAYETLFKHVQITTPYIGVGTSIPAQIEGMNSLSDNIKIIKGVNDTLGLKVDGEDKIFKLNEGTYTRQQLINELNQQSTDTNADITFSVLNSRLIITHNQGGSGHSIEIDDTSNAYMTLLCERLHPNYVDGKTNVTPPQEGSTHPTYEYTSGKVEGIKSISELIISEDNDTLSFNVSGEDVSIVLEHGSYNAETLRAELQKKIDEVSDNVIVGINYGGYIYFETKRKGEGQGFSSLSGTAYNDIFTYIRRPYTNISYGYETYSYIRGVKSIGNNVVIDENNKDLKFTYSENGKEEIIEILLEEGTYTTNDLIYEINTKLEEYRIKAELESSDVIKLTCIDAGSNYKIYNFSGGFYENVLSVKEILAPIYYTGIENVSDAYIVGRKDISGGVVINPYINDVLIFDLRYNGTIKETVSITLPAGHYTPEELVNMINEELDKMEIDYVRAEYGTVDSGTTADDSNKLVLRYINQDENGSYVIDGIRGSSAYSLFYNASGEPTPTYTIGIVDLSQGATIKSGENDTFSFDVDGEKIMIVLSEGEYTAEELLDEINNQLGENSKVIASYYEGRLKLSYKGVGFHTIDNIAGNARGTLFMKVDGRDELLEHHVQVGSNSDDSISFEPFYISDELLRINTTIIIDNKSAKKALIRLDGALESVLSQRGRVGAYQNKLEHIMNNLSNYSQNLEAAQSRIEDLDMAKEIMNYVKTELLQNLSESMLLIAKHDGKRVLQLIIGD